MVAGQHIRHCHVKLQLYCIKLQMLTGLQFWIRHQNISTGLTIPSKALKHLINLELLFVYLSFRKNCRHSIIFKITNAPSHLETLWRKMFVTNVMVSRWSPVFTANVPQPLPQPVCVLQRKPEIEDHNMRSFSHWAF